MRAEVSRTAKLLTLYASDYAQQARRPLASLAFILPLLALYEGGVVALGTQAVRNGADVWLRRLLDTLGLGQYFLLPVLTVGLLLAWHHTTRQRWRLSAHVLYGMYLECLVLGVALVAIGQLQGALVSSIDSGLPTAETAPLFTTATGRLARLCGYFGAGIYEEVLFRLMLLPAVAGCVKLLGGAPRTCIGAAVIVTSIAFSTAHYVGPQGEALESFSFAFRFLAGGFFAVLFVYRGFGIAAGTHALYDILVGMA